MVNRAEAPVPSAFRRGGANFCRDGRMSEHPRTVRLAHAGGGALLVVGPTRRTIRSTRSTRINNRARLSGMATDEAVWYGPRALTRVRQVCIPVELLRALNLDAGSELQFALAEDGSEIRVRPTGRSRTTKDEERA